MVKRQSVVFVQRCSVRVTINRILFWQDDKEGADEVGPKAPVCLVLGHHSAGAYRLRTANLAYICSLSHLGRIFPIFRSVLLAVLTLTSETTTEEKKSSLDHDHLIFKKTL